MSKTLNQADRDANETLKRVYRLIPKGLATPDDMAALDAAEAWLARGQTFGPASHVKHIDPITGQIKAVTFINMITGKSVGRVNVPTR